MSKRINDLIASSKDSIRAAEDAAERLSCHGTNASAQDRARIRREARDKKLSEIRSLLASEVAIVQAARDQAQATLKGAEYKLRLAQALPQFTPDPQLQTLLNDATSPEQVIDLFKAALGGNAPGSHLLQIEHHILQHPDLMNNTAFSNLLAPGRQQRTAPAEDALRSAREMYKSASAEYLGAYSQVQDFEDQLKREPAAD